MGEFVDKQHFVIQLAGNAAIFPSMLANSRRARALADRKQIREFEFPDLGIKFPVPICREFTQKAQWLREILESMSAEISQKPKNSLYFPC